jgi:pyruvate ferredoxin oxidoreductase gamma subunit
VSRVVEPDALIVQDPTLFKVMDVFAGLKPQGYVLVNTNKTFADLHIKKIVEGLPPGHAVTVPASELAWKHVGRPLPNAALLGAFSALTGLVRFESVQQAIAEAFPGKVGEANIAAAKDAYEIVTKQERAASAA